MPAERGFLVSARRRLIAALSEDSLGGIATLEDVTHAEQLADAYRAEILAEVGKPAVDESFFVPGRVYTRTLRTGIHTPTPIHLRFVCEHVTTDPKIGDREAWGWVLRSNGTRCMDRKWDHDYPGWTLAETGDDRG